MRRNKILFKLKIISFITLSTIPFWTIVSCSKTEESFEYFEIENLKIRSDGQIQGFVDENKNTSSELTIKENYEGIKIKSIGKLAFSDCGITKLILPTSLNEIGNHAFYNNNISELILPENLSIVGVSAFDSNVINTLTIDSKNFLEIRDSAFLQNKITNLKINGNVNTIGPFAFYQNKIKNLVLPNTITKIDKRAFFENELEQIEIPSSVVEIGNGAFQNNELTTLTLPNSGLNKIGDNSFSNNSLTSLSIPSSVVEIGNGAFSDNKFKLSSQIILPDIFDTKEERERIGIVFITKN